MQTTIMGKRDGGGGGGGNHKFSDMRDDYRKKIGEMVCDLGPLSIV